MTHPHTFLEVQNETDVSFFVELCRTPSGKLYLHVRNDESGHVKTKVDAHDYALLTPKDVEL